MDDPLIESDRQQNKSCCKMHPMVVAILVLCAITLSIVIVVTCGLMSPHISRKELERMGETRPLPKSYLIPDDVRTPVKNQAHRGTCYIFSTMGILEASYRRYGIRHGYLKENEYVKFCEQAYGLGLIKHCKENPKDIHCLGGAPNNKTADGQPEWLYYMQKDMVKYVLPDSLCPYRWEDSEQYECPGLEDAVKTNPISFTVKRIESAYSIDGIKRLLYRHEFPLTFSHVVLETTGLTPCDDNNTIGYGSEECLNCVNPCTRSSDGCCAKVVLPGYTTEGVFTTFGEDVVGGGHAMVLVGWNDEMAVESGVPGHDSHISVGGFIIKNSWNTTVGHSAEYWAQRHSLLDETAICPNVNAYQTWIPVNTTCIFEEKDVSKCQADKKHVGTQWIYGPTALKCNQATHDNHREEMYGWTGCNFDKTYYVAGDPATGFATPLVTIPKGSDGVRIYHLIEYEKGNVVEVTTNATTPFGFERLFEPVDYQKNSEHCGYYFMPYDTFLKSNIVNPTYGTDTPAFSYLDIEWDRVSFARGSTDSKYRLITDSTHQYAPPKFNGPLDFDNTN